MKQCPVCNTQLEDHYTGLCPNSLCSWEFVLANEITPEHQKIYAKKLAECRRLYELNIVSEKKIFTFKDKINKEFNPKIYRANIAALIFQSAVDGSNKWDFIDKLGNEAIPLKYDHANSFYKDLARVEQEVFVKVFPTPIIESLKVPMPDFESRFKLNSIVLNSPNIDLSIKLPDFNLSVPEYVTQKIPINKIKPKYNLKTSIFNFSKLYERIRRKTKT